MASTSQKILLKISNGSLIFPIDSLPGPNITYDLEIPESALKNQKSRDNGSHHITIVHKSETDLSDLNLDEIWGRYSWTYTAKGDDVEKPRYSIIGIGSQTKQTNTVWYYVVWFPAAQSLRQELNLPTKDFHITLGFTVSDIHDVRKDLSTIKEFNPALAYDLPPIVSRLSPSEKMEIYCIFMNTPMNRLNMREMQPELEQVTPTGTRRFREDSAKFLISMMLTDSDLKSWISKEHFDLLDRSLDSSLFASRAYLKLGKHMVYNARKLLTLADGFDPEDPMIGRELEKLSSIILESDAPEHIPRLKYPVTIWDDTMTLSRNFSWVIPFKLAGISIPDRDDIRAFEHMGVSLVVSVLEEEQLDPAWFTRLPTPIRNIQYPVPNYKPPSMEEIFEIIQEIERVIQSHSSVVVHCGGGKGRAGTVLACYVAKNGLSGSIKEFPQMSADEAIDLIRKLRPGSIETRDQEKFVSEFVNALWALK